jgi:hypothetical protein
MSPCWPGFEFAKHLAGHALPDEITPQEKATLRPPFLVCHSLTAPIFPGVFLPAPAQGGVEFHHGQLPGQARRQKVLSGREEGAFGVVHGEGALQAAS